MTCLIILAVVLGGGCNAKRYEVRQRSGTTGLAPTPGPQPKFLTIRSEERPPPPISGGTLAIAKDGRTAVAADPDRDAIYVVDLPTRTVRHTVRLADGAEPGRVAFDVHGRTHVALRGTGNIASIDLATGKLSEIHVCAAPRGLAYDASLDGLHVACAEGHLATVAFAAGIPIRRTPLDRDLRDVVLARDKILVSRFRAADVVTLSRTGEVEGKTQTQGGNLGWRMIAAREADDEVAAEPAIVSQQPTDPTGTSPVGYYGSGASDTCTAPTIAATRLDLPGNRRMFIPPAVLPVDLATNGREYAIVAAGNGHTPDLPQIFVHSVQPFPQDSRPVSGTRTNPDCAAMAKGFVPGQATAAAYDGEDQLIVQSREPAALYIMSPDRQKVWKEIRLSETSREDTGHAIFHSNSGGFLACASCHAEGGEDGRTWHFVEGDRRTPSMRGTLVGTAPFHWDGEIADLRHLVDHVFVTRMSGPEIDEPEVETLQTWLFRLPPPPKVERAPDAVARGEALFRQRACASCHAGAMLTNNESRDVGTGGNFQVPSLVGVGWRAPFLHNGCAKTLKDRFDGSCGGDKHGDISGLDPGQVTDLTSFLESL
jgi:hypothetical protein